ncbi:MAG: hypothetical protein ACI9MC_003070 [Kiritimatiellia bacterium]
MTDDEGFAPYQTTIDETVATRLAVDNCSDEATSSLLNGEVTCEDYQGCAADDERSRQ